MLKSDLLQFFYQRSAIKLNRKIFVFIVCLVISFFSWLQINLSKSQTDNILVKVDIVNAPVSKFGTSVLSDTIILEVEADGYDLLNYEMHEMRIEFNSLKKIRSTGSYAFLPANHSKAITKQMGENFKVLKSLTDTVLLVPRKRK